MIRLEQNVTALEIHLQHPPCHLPPIYPFCLAEHKHYRNFVLFTCKTLKSFDMSPVTQSERDMNAIWALTFRKKLFPDQED